MSDQAPFHFNPSADRPHVRLALPDGARAWVSAQLGGARITSTRALSGGISHANAALIVGVDPGHAVVLRRWTRPAWEIDDADYTVAREALAMGALAKAGIPAPRCLATDPTGEYCGAPALLMSRLPGAQPTAETARLPHFASKLAAAIRRIHERVVLPDGLSDFEAYNDLSELLIPTGATRLGLWKEMYEVLRGPAPQARRTFIHRDFHAGNTLWNGNHLTGIVDWTTVSAGPIGVDLSHMRANMVITGWRQLADDYLAAYLAQSDGNEHHPHWDLRVIADFGNEEFTPTEIGRIEDYLAETLARI
jgi:aminoglycoside phosphotransferase (APT) family kinase protein